MHDRRGAVPEGEERQARSNLGPELFVEEAGPAGSSKLILEGRERASRQAAPEVPTAKDVQTPSPEENVGIGRQGLKGRDEALDLHIVTALEREFRAVHQGEEVSVGIGACCGGPFGFQERLPSIDAGLASGLVADTLESHPGQVQGPGGLCAGIGWNGYVSDGFYGLSDPPHACQLKSDPHGRISAKSRAIETMSPTLCGSVVEQGSPDIAGLFCEQGLVVVDPDDSFRELTPAPPQRVEDGSRIPEPLLQHDQRPDECRAIPYGISQPSLRDRRLNRRA
jgi:hypothetical protein